MEEMVGIEISMADATPIIKGEKQIPVRKIPMRIIYKEEPTFVGKKEFDLIKGISHAWDTFKAMFLNGFYSQTIVYKKVYWHEFNPKKGKFEIVNKKGNGKRR